MTRSTAGFTTKQFYLALSAVAVLGAAWIAYTLRREPAQAEAPAPRQLTAAEMRVDGGFDLGAAKGDASALVVVQEFADYQCPACRHFATVSLTAQALDEAYVKTGKVRWIFFDFPLQQHRNAVPAAEAARCAGEQNAYWRMHDALFARQAEWANERNPKGKFREYARALGLDAGKLEDCLDSGRYRGVIRMSYERGVALGVGSTPTFFVGREPLVGAAPYEEFARLLEKALATAKTP